VTIERVFFIIIGIFLFIVVFVIMDFFLGKNIELIGTVIEKSYTASSTGVGAGPSMGGKGGVAVVVTANPEKYTLFVKLPDGETDIVTVDKDTWLKVQKDDRYIYCRTIGKFTGVRY